MHTCRIKAMKNTELRILFSRVTERPPNAVFDNVFRHVALNVKLRR